MDSHKENNLLRLSHFLPSSRANGPGVRAVTWVQGCSLGCPGCFNPDTHTFSGGKWVTIEELVAKILDLDESIEGVTISGGEPLQQVASVSSLLQRIKSETSLSTILFTGFTWKEIHLMNSFNVLRYVDVLIAGRFDVSQRLSRNLRGSANKTLHFLSNRYSKEDIQAVPLAELIITETGDVISTGINPVTVLSDSSK